MSIGNRRDEVIDAARPALADAFGGDGATDVVAVPDGTVTESDRAGWPSVARSLPPVQEQTLADAVVFAARQALARHDGPVFVLSTARLASTTRASSKSRRPNRSKTSPSPDSPSANRLTAVHRRW
jgi:hypothetical protein